MKNNTVRRVNVHFIGGKMNGNSTPLEYPIPQEKVFLSQKYFLKEVKSTLMYIHEDSIKEFEKKYGKN